MIRHFLFISRLMDLMKILNLFRLKKPRTHLFPFKSSVGLSSTERVFITGSTSSSSYSNVMRKAKILWREIWRFFADLRGNYAHFGVGKRRNTRRQQHAYARRNSCAERETPAYQNIRLKSLDLTRWGGLKETPTLLPQPHEKETLSVIY